MARRPQEILADLTVVAGQLEEAQARVARLFDERAHLFAEGRSLEDPITIKGLANAAGVSNETVMKSNRDLAARQG